MGMGMLIWRFHSLINSISAGTCDSANQTRISSHRAVRHLRYVVNKRPLVGRGALISELYLSHLLIFLTYIYANTYINLSTC